MTVAEIEEAKLKHFCVRKFGSPALTRWWRRKSSHAVRVWSKREPVLVSPLPKAPWSEVSMDFAELSNSEYLFIITDDYSGYPVVETVKSTSANTVIPKVDKVSSEFDIPNVVKTDNGPPFNSSAFKSFAQTLGFQHRKATARWPRANGEVE